MKSHDDNSTTSVSYICKFPTLQEALANFEVKSTEKGKKQYDISEFNIQIYFANLLRLARGKVTQKHATSVVNGIIAPDHNIIRSRLNLDDAITESPAYRVLLDNFNEIAKNYLYAETKTLKITFVLNKARDRVEIILDSIQKKPGFSVSFPEHFNPYCMSVDYQDILRGQSKIQSKKDKGSSFGGHGKGFAFMSQSLHKNGGKMLLESTPKHPARLRLQSPLTAVPSTELNIASSSDTTTLVLPKLFGIHRSIPTVIEEPESPEIQIEPFTATMSSSEYSPSDNNTTRNSPASDIIHSPTDFASARTNLFSPLKMDEKDTSPQDTVSPKNGL